MVTCTLCAFISLVWLREQIVHGGAPQWLEQNQQQPLNGGGQQNEVKLSAHLFTINLENVVLGVNTLSEHNSNVVMLHGMFFC